MKPANKRKRKFNNREVALIAAVLIIATTVIAWQIAGRQLHQEITELSKMNRSLSAEIASLDEILSRKDSIENNLAQMQADEARLNLLLPEISELPIVLGELERIVEYYESQIISFQVGEIEFSEGHASLPFKLSAEGSPYVTTAMIKALEAFPHLLSIDYLHWTSINSKDAAIDINFRIYFYNDPGRGY